MNKLANKYAKPSRYLYAEKSDGSNKATATWMLDKGVWFCSSASHHLRWMRNIRDFGRVIEELNRRGFTWLWRPGKDGVKPPFNIQP